MGKDQDTVANAIAEQHFIDAELESEASIECRSSAAPETMESWLVVGTVEPGYLSQGSSRAAIVTCKAL
jgi:hypothetical protein